MSLFNTMIQQLAPGSGLARALLAVYLFVFQGSVAAGSAIWGFAAQHTSAHLALSVSGIAMGASLLLQFPLRLPNTGADLSSWNHWDNPKLFAAISPDLGPVLVTVKYVIDPRKSADFLKEINRYQRIRRRDGATRWGIYYDTESPNVYLESFLVDSWAEHQRQHFRFTVADRELEKRVLSYALEPTTVKHYIYARH